MEIEKRKKMIRGNSIKRKNERIKRKKRRIMRTPPSPPFKLTRRGLRRSVDGESTGNYGH